MMQTRFQRLFLVALLMLGATACTQQQGRDIAKQFREGKPDEFFQTSVDRMATIGMRDNLQSLYLLMGKLYLRNPSQWRKSGFPDGTTAQREIRNAIEKRQPLPALGDRRDLAALSYSLSPEFQGDRVGAFIYAIGSMLVTAHGGRTEFYVYQGIDAQYVYNAARNVEVATWMLATRKDDKGAPLLLSNALTDDASNLSYAREFAKIVARLDLLAEVLGERYRRISVNYAQGLLFMHFLPVQ